MSRRARAPGKLMLAGEYAVLDGATCVMTTVDRYATARLGPPHRYPPSPFLAALAELAAARFGAGSPAAEAAERLVVDSTELASDDGVKLGLGSSAAVTVAGAALVLAQHDAEPTRAAIHELADAAHGQAQHAMGARGSGADVAASVHGGFLAFTRDTPVHPLRLPEDLALLCVWTGLAADTRVLVRTVGGYRARDPRGYERAITAIAAAAADLVGADTAAAAIAAIDRGGRALAALGTASRIDLVPEAVRRMQQLLAPLGGAVKPTGAGGGDVAVVAVARDAAANAAAVLARAGFAYLPLNLGVTGVELVAQQSNPSSQTD